MAIAAVGPLERTVAGGTAKVLFTTRAQGDLNPDRVDLAERTARQRSLVDRPWTMLREVHGARAVTVTRPGEHDGTVADAAVTKAPEAVLGIWVGDCAPVALVSPDGVIGVAHAGWRGLMAGVLPAAVAALRRLGARDVTAIVGPHIRPGCYPFGVDELDRLATRFGPSVRAHANDGSPALDLAAAITASLAAAGVAVADVGAIACTGCHPDYWSHRRGDRERQGMAVWMEPT